MLKSNVFDRNVPRGGCLTFQTITNTFRSHWHSHSEYEIVYIQSGKGVIQYGSTSFQYHAGQLLLLGPWVPHEFIEDSSNHHSISFLFTEHFLSIDLFQCQLSQQIKQMLKDSIFGLCFNLSEQHTFSQQIESINTQEGVEQAIRLFFILRALTEVSHQKLQTEFSIETEDTKFFKKYTQLQKILAYINQHLSKKLTLQEIADHFYISKSYLSQLFTDLIQTSFTHYLMNQRLYYACRLLATSEKSITEISDEVGFISQSSFNRSFLKAKNMSPREYRKRSIFLGIND